MSLGNYVDWMEEFSGNPEGISELTHHTYHSPWYTNLYEKKEFYQLVEADYREYVSPYLQQLLDGGLKNYKESLLESAQMNEIRWKQELMKNPYYKNREKTFGDLEQFIRERKAYLDNAWKSVDS
ncbi:MAG: hypothetical protein IKW28_11450 [Lachnospiraceae bacterium]|nr:hypothetical protein [Lachnospiraceae bacterium]